jgi:hypothetical protein
VPDAPIGDVDGVASVRAVLFEDDRDHEDDDHGERADQHRSVQRPGDSR